jgi:hypothetical protein
MNNTFYIQYSLSVTSCFETVKQNIGFEVLTTVVMKSTIFWDITPCSPLKVNRRFGGTYHLHLQGRRISRARNQRENKWQAEDFQLTTRCCIPEDSTLRLNKFNKCTRIFTLCLHFDNLFSDSQGVICGQTWGS